MSLAGRWTTVWAVLAAGIGLLFAVRVPLGLPYDEPSHWATVLFYATNGRMPELGQPGVTYEAQMGPVYYVLASFVVRLVPSSEPVVQAHVVRFAGVLLMPVLVVLTGAITRRLTSRPADAVVAGGVVATLPLLGAIGGSIQNDYLTFVLIAVALIYGIDLFRLPEPGWPRHMVLGVLIGVAVLTKIVALALVPAALVGYLAHRASVQRRLVWVVGAGVGLAATCGWWFLRNLLVYGDLTGARGLERLGVTFPRLEIRGPGDLGAVVSGAVSYIYIPVEYYRNLLQSPAVLRLTAGGLAVVTIGVALGYFVSRWSRLHRLTADPGVVFALGSLVFAIVGWLLYSLLFWYAPFRLVFQAAPVAAVLFAVVTRGQWRTILAVATLAAFVVAGLWLALSAAQVSDYPFLIR